jgi:hypothetical protein
LQAHINILLPLLLAASTACAQSGSRFTITRNIIASGGATTNSSARFQLASTIGQPLAAVPGSARFSIQGGFWIRPAPILFGPAKMGANFPVSIQSELGETCTLQYLNALGSSWQSLPPITGSGNVIIVTNDTVGVTQLFYRLVEHQ